MDWGRDLCTDGSKGGIDPVLPVSHWSEYIVLRVIDIRVVDLYFREQGGRVSSFDCIFDIEYFINF